MRNGILSALAACFIWGASFVIPIYMEGFSSVEITLGRYLLYGLTSALLMTNLLRKKRYTLKTWSQATLLGFLGSLGYYPFIVLSMRYSSPSICALISGITPIAIAFYGNWKKQEVPFSSLVIPSLLIFTGLLLINLPYLSFEESSILHLIGVGFGFIALAAWTWYAVANAHFLKTNTEINSDEWATLIGFTTFLCMIVAIPITGIFFTDALAFDKFTYWSPELGSFLIGCAILGIICSWLANYLWNIASTQLPLMLTSQLLIFETLFGLLFAYIVEWRLPLALESAGTLLLVTAIIYSLRIFTEKAATHS